MAGSADSADREEPDDDADMVLRRPVSSSCDDEPSQQSNLLGVRTKTGRCNRSTMRGRYGRTKFLNCKRRGRLTGRESCKVVPEWNLLTTLCRSLSVGKILTESGKTTRRSRSLTKRELSNGSKSRTGLLGLRSKTVRSFVGKSRLKSERLF